MLSLKIVVKVVKVRGKPQANTPSFVKFNIQNPRIFRTRGIFRTLG